MQTRDLTGNACDLLNVQTLHTWTSCPCVYITALRQNTSVGLTIRVVSDGA